MAGLVSDPKMMDPGAAATSEPPADDVGNPDTVPDDQGEKASPEEQAAYEEFVKTGFGLMYKGGEVNPKILKMLDDDPSDLRAALGDAEELQQFSPVVALAATAAILTLQVVRETKEQDGGVILHGGKAILEDLVEVAGKAGVKDFSEEEMGQAMHMGADMFRHVAEAEGLVNMDQAKEEWSQITAADKEGRLGEVIPQFAGMEQQPDEQPQEAPNGPA